MINSMEKALAGICTRLKSRSNAPKLLFILTGFTATLWFLIRVIPKPSRAAYPCMRAAAPVMSTFIIYMAGLLGSAWAFKAAGRKFRQARYLPFAALLVSGLLFLGIPVLQKPGTALASATTLLEANTPVGIPRGAVPGRVTWMWDAGATNEHAVVKNRDDMYILPKNTNRDVVQEMVDHSVNYLAGENNLSDSWEALFSYFNSTRGKGQVGYASGEKIFIKMNLVGQWGINTDHYQIANYTAGHTTPQVVMALLDHLVNVVGADQQDISLGDPIQQFPKEYYEIISTEFPDVNFISSTAALGQRTLAVIGPEPAIFYSDKGSILREGDPDSWGNSDMGGPVTRDSLYTVILEADYLINVANLKGHERAGVSMCAKNHFGSHGRFYAKQLHMGLVHPDQAPNEISRDTYGQYRVLVDLMGHEKLGGNTLLFVLDALYSAPGAGSIVVKSKSFGNDWMSSIFMSQDHVAIESVGLDFAREEYQEKYQSNTYPQYNAVEDYLLQAADPAYWPEGFVYDPENDGTPLGSLGVYESWNNPVDKLYSGNLGGSGIELVKVHEEIAVGTDRNLVRDPELQAWPNPFTDRVHFSCTLEESCDLSLEIYSLSGQLVHRKTYRDVSGYTELSWDGDLDDSGPAAPGSYVVRLSYLKNGSSITLPVMVNKQ